MNRFPLSFNLFHTIASMSVTWLIGSVMLWAWTQKWTSDMESVRSWAAIFMVIACFSSVPLTFAGVGRSRWHQSVLALVIGLALAALLTLGILLMPFGLHRDTLYTFLFLSIPTLFLGLFFSGIYILLSHKNKKWLTLICLLPWLVFGGSVVADWIIEDYRHPFRQIILIPNDYSGFITIYRKQPKGQLAQIEKGYQVVRIDSNGVALVKFTYPPTLDRRDSILFYTVDRQAKRRQLEFFDSQSEVPDSLKNRKVLFDYSFSSYILCRPDSLSFYQNYPLDLAQKRDSLLSASYPIVNPENNP